MLKVSIDMVKVFMYMIQFSIDMVYVFLVMEKTHTTLYKSS
jgi:hypothetical protein